MFLARFAVAKTTSAVGAAVYMPDGSGIAPNFNAQLLIAEKFGSASPASGTFRKITGQTVPTFNVLDETIDAGTTILIAQDVAEVWTVFCKY